MIKRTSLSQINNLLKKNPSWNILDIGCGYTANFYANTVADAQDLSSYYKNKNFIKINENKLPFKDNEFDFVITSHVIEHVKDLDYFLKEIQRISKKGYIEVPNKLEDNLVFENKKEHIWQLDFDDIENRLIISNKVQYFEPILTVSTAKKFQKVFRRSLVIELIWNNSIEYLFEKNEDEHTKFSLIVILRKFFSKKIRNLFK